MGASMTITWETLQSHYAVRLLPKPRGAPELRAVAALLSMARGVSEFGGRIVRRAGGPRNKDMRRYMQCITEVPFVVLSGETHPHEEAKRIAKLPKHRRHYDRPDGVIFVRKGSKEWKALVEVKVRTSKLEDDPEQIVEYHRQACDLGFDVLITMWKMEIFQIQAGQVITDQLQQCLKSQDNRHHPRHLFPRQHQKYRKSVQMLISGQHLMNSKERSSSYELRLASWMNRTSSSRHCGGEC